jgi:hypothetical protein
MMNEWTTVYGVYRTWWERAEFPEEGLMKLFHTEEKAKSYVEYLVTEYGEYHKRENLVIHPLIVY